MSACRYKASNTVAESASHNYSFSEEGVTCLYSGQVMIKYSMHDSSV